MSIFFSFSFFFFIVIADFVSNLTPSPLTCRHDFRQGSPWWSPRWSPQPPVSLLVSVNRFVLLPELRLELRAPSPGGPTRDPQKSWLRAGKGMSWGGELLGSPSRLHNQLVWTGMPCKIRKDICCCWSQASFSRMTVYFNFSYPPSSQLQQLIQNTKLIECVLTVYFQLLAVTESKYKHKHLWAKKN